MDKRNGLLAELNKIYGVKEKGVSRLRRVVQKFDRETNEHVTVFEYRVKEGSRSDPKPAERPRKKVPRKEPESQLELLQDINRRAVLRKSPAKGPQRH